MKCADSAVIARSACAKVRRLGGWPVMRALFRGSASASASGCLASTLRNNPSSVGVALIWITGSLGSRITCFEDHLVSGSFGLRLRPLRPGFRQVSGQRGGDRSFYPIPACDPLLLHVKEWN